MTLGRLHRATATSVVLVILGKAATIWAWSDPAWMSAAAAIEGYFEGFWPVF